MYHSPPRASKTNGQLNAQTSMLCVPVAAASDTSPVNAANKRRNTYFTYDAPWDSKLAAGGEYDKGEQLAELICKDPVDLYT